MATAKKVPAKKVESKARKTAKDFVKKVVKAVKAEPKVPAVEAVAPVAAPAIEPTFSFDSNNHIALIPLIQYAWDAVKGAGDADFAHAIPSFCQTLLAHALSALKGGVTLAGDQPLAQFEREIVRLKQASNQ